MFACNGTQIGLAKLFQGYRLSASDGHYISTQGEGRKSIKLKNHEIALQVCNIYYNFVLFISSLVGNFPTK